MSGEAVLGRQNRKHFLIILLKVSSLWFIITSIFKLLYVGIGICHKRVSEGRRAWHAASSFFFADFKLQFKENDRPERKKFFHLFYFIYFLLQFANVYGIFFLAISKALDAVATEKIGGQVKAEVLTDDGKIHI